VRYAVVADIHANLPALEAVLADIAARHDVDVTYHLGDLVGYAPWPDEVVALLREHAIPGVAGNYDSTTATDYAHCGCRYEDPRQEELAHVSYEWTRARVSAGTKQFLGGLPFRIDVRPLGGHTAGPRLVLVHGNPVLNTVYWTEDRPDRFCVQMAESVSAKAGDIIAFGHTHRPWTRVVDGVRFVNAGSVGRPKDGDARACYAIVSVTAEAAAAEHVRVEYDVERAAAAIVESGLPVEFAEHLRTGGAASASAPTASAGAPADARESPPAG
jgi:predicted phosphodiesterase